MVFRISRLVCCSSKKQLLVSYISNESNISVSSLESLSYITAKPFKRYVGITFESPLTSLHYRAPPRRYSTYPKGLKLQYRPIGGSQGMFLFSQMSCETYFLPELQRPNRYMLNLFSIETGTKRSKFIWGLS